MTSERLIIGKITSAHGVRGEVSVFPLTDDAGRFLKLKNCFFCDENADNTVACTVKNARIDRDRVLIRFKGIEDRDKAEALRGKYLCVNREDAVKLKEGSFFIEDLKGLEVKDDERGILGNVKDVYRSGTQFIMTIGRAGKQDLLVPFVKEIFYEVDPSRDILKCRLPQGLYELYEV